MKEGTTQEKIRALHECSSDVYNLIDHLNEIGIDIGLGYQNLRDATINIQKAISGLIDKITEKPNGNGNN
jgi:hypothetical protein